MTSGRKLWTSTSERSTRRRIIACPSGCLRSTASPRLFRLRLRKTGLSPSTGSGLPREMSPESLRSTLTTSAQKSLRTWVHAGHISTCVKSSTRTPCKAWVMAAVLRAKTAHKCSSDSSPGRLPLFSKRERAFATILRPGLAEHVLVTTIDGVCQWQVEAAPRRLLAGAHPERRALQDRVPPATGGAEQVFPVHDLAYPAPAL